MPQSSFELDQDGYLVSGSRFVYAKPNPLDGSFFPKEVERRTLVFERTTNNLAAALAPAASISTVTLSSPDAGRTEWRYELGGNLGAKETAALRAKNKLIRYEYDFGRLKKVDYPDMVDAVYTYGGPGEGGDALGNRAGRIKRMVMEGGIEDRWYDRLGQVVQTSSTMYHLREPHLSPMQFTMQFAFDSFGRMQRMVYPNWVRDDWATVPGPGEEVKYVYDRGGLLDKITGFVQTPNPQTQQPRNFTYLRHMGYDEFEQRTVLVSGNGIANKYKYSPERRWITDITGDAYGTQEKQQGRGPTAFHRLRYSYDLVGNIRGLQNTVPVVAQQNGSVRVGPLDVSYSYDKLYQLTSSNGIYRGWPGHGFRYNTAFTYDEIGNLSQKAQSQDRLVWANNDVSTGLSGSRFDHNVRQTTYTLDYRYESGRPHAASKTIETLPDINPAPERVYSFDASGNNTGNVYRNSDRRGMVWDEEDRLKLVNDNGGLKGKFLYSPDGERTHKQTAAGTAFYVNQFYGFAANKLPMKHVFAGETRISTKTDPISYQKPIQTFYHPDHLGTTSYVTNEVQDLVQHERYFPFGELWRDAEQEETDTGRPDNMRREWLFTGKEWDWDTGLYYYGARYYDARNAQWLSADPILADYMRGGPNKGVFTPRNLGLYAYTWNNPVTLRDPTGRCPETNSSGPCDEAQVALLEGRSSSSEADNAMTMAAVGIVPFVGDLEDLASLMDPSASNTERLIAAGSLILGLGPLPNVGPAARAADKVNDAKRAASAEVKAATGGAAGGPRSGKSFTSKGKAEIDAENAARNGGANVCENCGTTVVPGQRSQAGVTPPRIERQRDHIIPKSKGGDGDPPNGQVLCRGCNLEKSNTTP